MKASTLDASYSSAGPFRIEVMRRLGFTDRQAEFLAHVLVFSGVFMERQVLPLRGPHPRSQERRLSADARRSRLRPGDCTRQSPLRPVLPPLLQAAL